MTDITLETAEQKKSGFLTIAFMQKAVAFAVLLLLLAFFCIFAPCCKSSIA